MEFVIIRRATKKPQKEWIKEMERKQKNESNKRRMDKDSDRQKEGERREDFGSEEVTQLPDHVIA